MVGHTIIKRLLLLIPGFLLFSSLVFPLDPNKAISQYTLDVMGIEKGLPQSTVYTVIRSKVGYIWLGTEEGLVRFDGVNFKVYDKRNVPQILNNFIKVLCEDS
ncbi:MAG TPA: two-component regulator propeller domain-containing protein, partial [Candidatus Kapabacteria bacterium]|nr:two-component regulator propeller domain-containing protein [Candidatus Kapabacteria bacterium]